MSLNLRTLGLFLIASFSATQAFSVPIFSKWYEGKWSCTDNGHTATMQWSIERVPVVCVKAPCPPNYMIYTTGLFTEQDAPTQKLEVVSETKFDLEFTHGDDVEPWYLAYDAGLKVAIGHSKIGSQRYPLT